jgi:hypothetical protein
MRIVLNSIAVLVLLLSLGLAAGLALYLPTPGPVPARSEGPVAEATLGTDDRSGDFSHQLARLEAAVDQQRQPGPFGEQLRTAAIRLSMADPLQPLTQRTLINLGQRPAWRYGLFFLMPLVGWMSEPFLYPLPIGEDAGIRLQALIEARAEAAIRVTLDNVGDAARTPAEAAAYLDFYRGLIQAAAGSHSSEPIHLSLKLSALAPDWQTALGVEGESKRRELLEALRGLLSEPLGGPPAPIFIRIDMEEFAYKDLTLALWRELIERSPELALDASGQPRIGVVIQAYLRDSARDLAALADWGEARGIRIPVRLVKGAYADYEKNLAREQGRASPVWDFKASTDANYALLADYLLRHPQRFDARFATHNLNTQAWVMALAASRGYRSDQVEFQMLYGMGEPIKNALVALGYRVREYVPAGSLDRGLGYAGRRFSELSNPDNALARTLLGNYTALQSIPEFAGARDRADAQAARGALLIQD